MSDEKVVVDDQIIDEDKTKENESQEGDDKDLKSALAQKEHFRTKVEMLEKEKEELLAQVEKAETKEETPTPTQTEQPNKDVDSLKDRLARIEFSQENPHLDAGDIEDIFQLAELNRMAPKEILEKNEMVKNHLEKKAGERKVADATPENNRSVGITPEKPISEMTRDEHKEFAEKVMGQ